MEAISHRAKLVEVNASIDQEARAALLQKLFAFDPELLPQPDSYFVFRLENQINPTLESLGMKPELAVLSEPTAKRTRVPADLTLNIGASAKESGLPINVAGNSATKALTTIEDFSLISAVGPFINISLDANKASHAIFAEISAFGDSYGHTSKGKAEVVVVDYSSPNVAKMMTVAHLRSTIIGSSILRICEATGDITFGVNHIGDWGTQFGGLFYQYQKELKANPEAFQEELQRSPTETLLRIYRQFTSDANEDPTLRDEAGSLFLKLEQGDEELTDLWLKFKDWSLVDFHEVYQRLGIHFDAVQGESFYQDKMDRVVNRGIERGIFRRLEDGSVIFPSQPIRDIQTDQEIPDLMLDKEGNPKDEVIIRPDGSTNYLTRDLAAILYRREVLGAKKIIYVIGKEQNEHCQMLFGIARALGIISLNQAVHVSFGHLNVKNDDGRATKMSSRSGAFSKLSDILDQSEESARQLLGEKTDLSNLTDEDLENLRKIGNGYVIFNDLRRDRTGDILFDAEQAATIQPGGANYLQYTYVRIARLIEKANSLPGEEEFNVSSEQLSDDERAALVKLMLFPQVIVQSYELLAPNKVANYLTDLCQLANSIYQNSSVINEENRDLRSFRLRLFDGINQVIKNGTHLLNIELPSRM